MTERNIFFAIDILDGVRCQGTFRQDAENKVVVYVENDQVAELQDFYFPVFEVRLYRAGGELYLFVCSNEVSVYYLDEENRCKPRQIGKFAPNIYFDCVINLTVLNERLLYVRTGDRRVAFFDFVLTPQCVETTQLLNTSLYSIQFVPRLGVENQFISLALPTDHDAVLQLYGYDPEQHQLSKIQSDMKLPIVPDKVFVLDYQGDRPSKIIFMTMQQVGMWEMNPQGQLESTVLCSYAGFLVYNFALLPNNLLCIVGTCVAIYDLERRKFRLANGFKDFGAENIIYTEKYGLILVGNGMKRIKNLEEVLQDDVDPMELVRKLSQ